MNRKQGSWLETYLLVFGLAALMLLSLTGSVRAQENDDEDEFDLVSICLEYNATDNDAEAVIEIDAGVGLREIKVVAPNKKTVVSLTSKTTPKLGQSQVLVETPELPLDEIKAVYPAGVYQFRAKTVDGGDKIIGEATLSYTLLPAPVINTPSNEATGVPVDGQVLTWPPVTRRSRVLPLT